MIMEQRYNSAMKKYIIGGVVIAVIAVLLGWGKISGTAKPLTFWNNTKIQCLADGHTNLAMHIHQMLIIKVDGVAEQIPANIGIDPRCMAELHTHDATGKMHEEAVTADKQFTLGDFFIAWGKPLIRPGYSASLIVNGAPHPEMGNFVLADNQEITLLYVSDAAIDAGDKATSASKN